MLGVDSIVICKGKIVGVKCKDNKAIGGYRYMSIKDKGVSIREVLKVDKIEYVYSEDELRKNTRYWCNRVVSAHSMAMTGFSISTQLKDNGDYTAKIRFNLGLPETSTSAIHKINDTVYMMLKGAGERGIIVNKLKTLSVCIKNRTTIEATYTCSSVKCINSIGAPSKKIVFNRIYVDNKGSIKGCEIIADNATNYALDKGCARVLLEVLFGYSYNASYNRLKSLNGFNKMLEKEGLILHGGVDYLFDYEDFSEHVNKTFGLNKLVNTNIFEGKIGQEFVKRIFG